ncbi:hypothetical protein Scep_014600 [Stephania cephalantha]|uniref:Uncharacterized protein n=1 Tax=Stephania cephalantha TaxID=152367 RepID=A0AAP0P0N7_9MAGN
MGKKTTHKSENNPDKRKATHKGDQNQNLKNRNEKHKISSTNCIQKMNKTKRGTIKNLFFKI